MEETRQTIKHNGKPAKKPVTKGVAKVPVVMQLEALECGAAALAMVMAYYGLWVPLEQVRLDCGVSRDGSKARNIYLAAESYGFNVQAFRMSPEALKENGTFPCIIHWNMNHFVVLDGFKGNYAYINDPARGQLRVTWEEFDNSFTGVTIVPVPSENFVPGGKRRSTIDFARKRLRGAGPAVVFVMLTTAIAYLFGIVNSVTGKIFMDRLLSGTNPDWLYPFTFAMLGFAFLQIIVDILAGHVVFVKKHESGIAENFIFLNASFFQIVQIITVRNKDVLNVVQIVKVNVFEIFRFADESDINFIFIEQAQRFVGRLAADGNADMGITTDKFF